MKFETNSPLPCQENDGATTERIRLPEGLIGFPDLQDLEVVADPEHIPFVVLREAGAEDGAITFLAVEPAGLIEDYQIELLEADAEALGLDRPEDAFLFNIVTQVHSPPRKLLVNLVGPVVVNRWTGEGRQVVIANYQSYSPRHVLFQEETEPAEAAGS